MGLGGISPWSLLLILVIVLVLFGTKRLRNMGSDLGGAFKSFKNAMRDENAEAEAAKEKENTKITQDNNTTTTSSGRVIDAEVRQKDNA